ncbi:MAG: hypothetical protein V1863_01230 [Candidatus Omnitrophota bacterium]
MRGNRQGKIGKRGQQVMEYAVLIAIVSAACLTMAMYIRRAVQGKLYTIEAQVASKANETPTPGFWVLI